MSKRVGDNIQARVTSFENTIYESMNDEFMSKEIKMERTLIRGSRMRLSIGLQSEKT